MNLLLAETWMPFGTAPRAAILQQADVIETERN